jgi:hypothetical protein
MAPDTLKRRRAAWVPRALVLGYLLVMAFPGEYCPMRTGLDASWRYGLNQLARLPYRFGRDVVFTYGPLGYLLWPLDVGSNLADGLALRLILHAALIVLVGIAAQRIGRALPALLFVLSLAPVLDVYEYLPLVVLALGLWLAVECGSAALLAGSALLTVALAMMKLTLGVGGLLMFAVASTLWAARARRGALRPLCIGWSALGLALALATRRYFGSLAELGTWVRLSLEMMRGYNATQGLDGAMSTVLIAVGCLSAFGLFLLAALRGRWRSRAAAALLLPGLLVAWKHGFVRQDGHEYYFFAFSTAAFGLLALAAARGRELAAAAAGMALAMLGVFSTPSFNLAAALHRYLGKRGSDQWAAARDWDGTRRALRQASEEALTVERLPPAERALIGATAVDTPMEISLCAANDLAWHPMPTLQEYSNYTPALDRFSAAHYASADAPELILFDVASADGRNPVLNAPATWRAILANYAPIAGSPHVLLRRRSTRSAEHLTPLGRQQVQVGRWVALPEAPRYLLGAIDLEPGLLGRLKQALLRTSPIELELAYADGRRARFRLAPPTAADGLLLSAVPADAADLIALAEGRSPPRVMAMRLSGPGALDLPPTVWVTWSRWDDGPPAVRDERPALPLHLALIDRPPGFDLFIDRVNGQRLHGAEVDPIDAGEPILSVEGWALDPVTRGAAGGVAVELDGERRVAGLYGLARPDVGAHFGRPELSAVGWSIGVPLSTLRRGRHRMAVLVAAADRRSFYRPPNEVSFEIQ